jgi:hypothetical protein
MKILREVLPVLTGSEHTVEAKAILWEIDMMVRFEAFDSLAESLPFW